MFDFDSYSTEKIKDILFSANKELEKRETAQRAKDWEAVVYAIKYYCRNWGKIHNLIEYGDYINEECDFDTVGCIDE
jgi:hypothetical protein